MIYIPLSECIVNTGNETVQSGNWPGRYPYNTRCGYLIEVEEDSHVLLNFTHFDLGDTRYTQDDFPNCGWDFLQVNGINK